jgi:hypothetical protein
MKNADLETERSGLDFSSSGRMQDSENLLVDSEMD